MSWDGQGVPPDAAHKALVRISRPPTDEQALGEAVRRLNSAASGFRTLLARTTIAAVEAAPNPARSIFVAIDPRWKDPRFWLALKEAMPPYTDRNLLAAVDHEARRVGQHRSRGCRTPPLNRLIMLRTFLVAAMVTIACAAIGLPYAMLAASLTGWKRVGAPARGAAAALDIAAGAHRRLVHPSAERGPDQRRAAGHRPHRCAPAA